MSCCETPYSNFDIVGDGASSIAGLSDVALINLANDEVLKYNSTTEKWENGTVSGGGGGQGNAHIHTGHVTAFKTNISSGVNYTVTNWTMDINTDNDFNTLTGEFTSSGNHYYRVNFTDYLLQPNNQLREHYIEIHIDRGSGYVNEYRVADNGDNAFFNVGSCSFNSIIELNNNDKLKFVVRISTNNGLVGELFGINAGGRRFTFFSIERV